ncbi:MAG: hypothetical protein MJ197_10445 [Bacteroidales bacterium]|nr:hypothetical protein [Bacteroidales bacterium]
MQNSIHIPFLDCSEVALQSVPDLFKRHGVEYHEVSVINWNEFPYLPKTQFAMAHSLDGILLHFMVIEDEVRGFVTEDLGPVSSDSCVEFFACMGEDDLYYNIECNCLGYVSMGVRKTRNDKEHASSEILKQIKRYTSLGNQYIGEIKKQYSWDCVLEIPYSAFFKHTVTNLSGKDIRANFYKCGGSGELKHYVSWNPIVSNKPDFHRPECFGLIHFD